MNFQFSIFNFQFKKKLLIFILLFLLTTIGAKPVVAQDTASSSAQPSQYQLPYPGLLPDHPLYFIKTFRDRIIAILIMDPLKKADFMLKSADKHLSMTIALVDQGKQDLAAKTEKEGEGYLVRALELLRETKKDTQDKERFKSRLFASLEKHEQTLLELSGRTDGSVKDSFSAMAKDVSNKRKSL